MNVARSVVVVMKSGDGLPSLPAGQAFVVDLNGDYVVDLNGDYVTANE